MIRQDNCRYCDEKYQTDEDRIILENDYFIANLDGHSVSKGHIKIVSRNHRDSLEDLTFNEAVAYRDPSEFT